MKTRNIALTLGLFAAFTASANTGGNSSSGAGMGTSGNNTTSVPAPQAGTSNNTGITNNDGSVTGNQGGTANDPTMGSATGNTTGNATQNNGSSITGRTGAFGTNAENNAAVTNNSASFGSRQSIMDAQRSLVNQGFSVSVDGRNGAQTQAAVRRFQARNGLPETGVIDSRTQEALSSSGTSTTQPSASDTSAE